MAPHPITPTRTMVLSFSVVLRGLVSCALGVNFACVISHGSCVYCFRPTHQTGEQAEFCRFEGKRLANQRRRGGE